MVQIRVSLRVIRLALLVSPVILSAVGLAVEVASWRAADPELYGLVRLLSLSQEGNFPTLYQGAVLVASGAVLGLVARAKATQGDPWRRYWAGLGAGFVFMGLDEWTSIHELWNQLFDLPGILFFGWIVPYGLVAVVCGFVFIPFLRSLPRPLAVRFVVAGVVYLGGALGMELPLGWWTDRHGIDNFGYAVIDWGEESLELVGAALFADSLLGLYRANVGSVRLDTTDPEPAERPTAS